VKVIEIIGYRSLTGGLTGSKDLALAAPVGAHAPGVLHVVVLLRVLGCPRNPRPKPGPAPAS
ncbi:MAG: hypothetical protein M3256_08085, partial [Actinomycetota bacterium]|nr:hypothetical protein [Actinomycetota bacterium]